LTGRSHSLDSSLLFTHRPDESPVRQADVRQNDLKLSRQLAVARGRHKLLRTIRQGGDHRRGPAGGGGCRGMRHRIVRDTWPRGHASRQTGAERAALRSWAKARRLRMVWNMFTTPDHSEAGETAVPTCFFATTARLSHLPFYSRPADWQDEFSGFPQRRGPWAQIPPSTGLRASGTLIRVRPDAANPRPVNVFRQIAALAGVGAPSVEIWRAGSLATGRSRRP